MENLNQFFATMSDYLWGWPMIILLLGTHIFLTVRLGFPQRKLLTAIKISVSKDKGSTGDVSQFGALATALAATIGTGNIVGVATAVALGGPGAVLWCWLSGVFGIATKYSEGLLAIKYRVKASDGRMLGGPMYALERGLGWKWAGVLFALFCAIASFGTGVIPISEVNASIAVKFSTSVAVVMIASPPINFAMRRASSFAPPTCPLNRLITCRPRSSIEITAGSCSLLSTCGAIIRTAIPTAPIKISASNFRNVSSTISRNRSKSRPLTNTTLPSSPSAIKFDSSTPRGVIAKIAERNPINSFHCELYHDRNAA